MHRPGDAPVSRTITQLLRDALPPEVLSCTSDGTTIVIQGPTSRYAVDRAAGAISALEATRRGRVVAQLSGPVDLFLDDVSLAQGSGGATRVESQGSEKVVLLTQGRWGSVPYALLRKPPSGGLRQEQTTSAASV